MLKAAIRSKTSHSRLKRDCGLYLYLRSDEQTVYVTPLSGVG